MPKRLPTTPRSHVRQVIRRYIWLRSRERAAALKRDNYTCVHCGKKQSKAKGREQAIECHHCAGIGNWEAVIDMIYKEILCNPDLLETVCPECHNKWEEYERRKQELWALNLSPDEYQRRIRAITDELGI